MQKYHHLFTPFCIGNIKIKNRLCVSAMGIRNFDAKGSITNEGIHYYTDFAKGGFGLITSGSMAVDTEIDGNKPVDRLLPLGHRKNFLYSCTQLTDRVHSYGSKMFAQLSMGVGRNGYFKSASPNPSFFDPSFITGELTQKEIRRKIELLAESAALCQEAGFDGIEIHAMHWGYLLDQFAMSLTNRRTDHYGGVLENRMRIMHEIVDAVKTACGKKYPVIMRLGLKSYLTGDGLGHASLTGKDEIGRTLDEGIRICKLLENFGYDALSCDVGTYESFYHACPPMYVPKGAYLPLAEAAKKEVDIPILLGGRMNDFTLANDAIEDGKIDAVCVARPALADPHFPRKLAMGTPEKIRPCLACCQCINSDFRFGGFSGCTVNPAVTRELSYGLSPALQSKKVVVVGGGVSGMEAALTAKRCGHDVTLLEASNKLGGNLFAAENHPFKQDIRDLREWFQNELAQSGVDIHLNTIATLKLLRELKAQTVILAIGSSAIMPHIPGIRHPKCVSCIDVLTGKVSVGNRIAVVGGGMTGTEIALNYASEGKKVTLIEAKSDILSSGPSVPLMQDMMIRDLLKAYQVDIRTGYQITGIYDEGAVIQPVSAVSQTPSQTEDSDIEDTIGSGTVITADTIIMAVGFRPNISIESELFGTGIDCYTIGDANRVGNIKTAIWDAYEIARNL